MIYIPRFEGRPENIPLFARCHNRCVTGGRDLGIDADIGRVGRLDGGFLGLPAAATDADRFGRGWHAATLIMLAAMGCFFLGEGEVLVTAKATTVHTPLNTQAKE
jgi:hypothetical protein